MCHERHTGQFQDCESRLTNQCGDIRKGRWRTGSRGQRNRHGERDDRQRSCERIGGRQKRLEGTMQSQSKYEVDVGHRAISKNMARLMSAGLAHPCTNAGTARAPLTEWKKHVSKQYYKEVRQASFCRRLEKKSITTCAYRRSNAPREAMIDHAS